MEDEAAVGCMRNPAVAILKLPRWVRVGTILRKTIEDNMCGRCGVRGEVDPGCEVPHHRRGYRRAGWQSWGGDRARLSRKGCDRGGGRRSAGDPDRPLVEWLESCAPTGVACDVEVAGIFPSARRFWAQAEPLANYASVEEHEKLVRAEIGRLRERGLCHRAQDVGRCHQAVRKCCRVKKGMAAVVKPREDGTTKLRLIIDMLRSHVNEHVRLHERIVLPRIVDMVRDSVSLLEGSSDGGDVDLMILDWEDPFHTMGVRAEDIRS